MARLRTRSITFVNGVSPIPGAVMNDLQDNVAALNEGRDLVLHDDFLGGAINPALWNIVGTVTGYSIGSDTPAKGALVFSDATGATTGHLETQQLGLGTDDFELFFYAKVISLGGASSQWVFGLLGTHTVAFRMDSGETNWRAFINGVFQASITPVAINNAAYQECRIVRESGVLSFYVDGTLLYQTSTVVDLTDAKLYYQPIRSTSGTTAAKMDFVNLWGTR